jgi:hypothetical protein
MRFSFHHQTVSPGRPGSDWLFLAAFRLAARFPKSGRLKGKAPSPWLSSTIAQAAKV